MTHFRRNLLIEISIALVVIIALIWGVFFFRKRISNAATDIMDSREKISGRLESLKLFNFLQSQYTSKGSRYLSNLHNFIPSYTELFELAREFEVISTQAGLDPQPGIDLIVDEEATATNIGRVQFNFTVRGNIENIFRFVQMLQNFHYLMTIDSFNLDRRESKVLMSIRGHIFFRPEPEL